MYNESFEDLSAFLCHHSVESVEGNPEPKEETPSNSSTKDLRLLKNKLSAKQSREKKKKHLENLEKKTELVMKQIAETDQELKKTKAELDKLLQKGKQHQSFNHEERPTYDRLKTCINSDIIEMDEDEVHMLVELLINRVGVTGKQRRRNLQYFSNRLINFSVPAIYRYVLKTANEDRGLLLDLENGTQNPVHWDLDFLKDLKLTPEQRQKLFKLKPCFVKELQLWNEQISKISSLREKIYGVSASVQTELLRLKQFLSIKQVGYFITCLENKKYCKEISYDLDKFEDPSPSKKVKTDQSEHSAEKP